MDAQEMIDDLVGGPAKPSRVDRAQQVLENLTAQRRRDRSDVDDIEFNKLSYADVMQGVTVATLTSIFHKDRQTVLRLLQNCPPIKTLKAGNIYDLKVAAQYLVTPVFDIAETMRKMRPADLPPHLQKEYWTGLRERQKYEEDAGDLWRTTDVIERLGEVYKIIKETMQLWPDEIERAHGLTPEQRQQIVDMADGMQQELHDQLIEMPKRGRTPSMKEHHDHTEVIVVEEDFTDLV